MSEIRLECQGLPCPQPVLRCKNAIEKDAPDSIVVLVDNGAAKENVSRFLTMQGYACTVAGDGPEFTICGTRDGAAVPGACAVAAEAEAPAAGPRRDLVFLAADVVGSGDDELGHKLMFNFVSTLKEMGDDLWRVVMLNGGVKLSVAGHPCLEPLRELEQSGVSVLVCGTCLEFFGLSGKNGVGDVTNMLDIVTSFQLATKVIRV